MIGDLTVGLFFGVLTLLIAVLIGWAVSFDGQQATALFSGLWFVVVAYLMLAGPPDV